MDRVQALTDERLRSWRAAWQEGCSTCSEVMVVDYCLSLKAAAKDCADELEAEVKHRYYGSKPDEPLHPAMQGRYERDMEPVEAVRALLPEEDEHG